METVVLFVGISHIFTLPFLQEAQVPPSGIAMGSGGGAANCAHLCPPEKVKSALGTKLDGKACIQQQWIFLHLCKHPCPFSSPQLH